MERSVAIQLNASRSTSAWLEHVGGKSNPDFIGCGRLSGMNFDITAEAARAAHLARLGYGTGLNIIPYQRPWNFSVFPRLNGQ